MSDLMKYTADNLPEDVYTKVEPHAQVAYASYGDAVGWRNFTGQPMPTWENLTQRIRAAWVCATQSMIAIGADERKKALLAAADVADRLGDPRSSLVGDIIREMVNQ